jgi:hypothetical protein
MSDMDTTWLEVEVKRLVSETADFSAFLVLSPPTMAPNSQLERCEELWFDDGSVVLCAENVVFRLYKGLLASSSTVFRDMLAFPQPTDGSAETYDGLPLVEMPDSYYDMTQLLKAMHLK